MTSTTFTTTDPTAPPPEDGPPAGPAETEAFMGHVAGQAAAALNGALVALGDRLGLWRAMAGAGPLSVAALAERAGGLDRRALTEWLAAQVANGLVAYDPAEDRYQLGDAGAAVLADEDGPSAFIGGFAMLPLLYRSVPALVEVFRHGGASGWLEWDSDLHDAEERFTRPLHVNLLVDGWLAGVPGLVDQLDRGALVADIGCGYGTSTIVLARRFPASRFVGFDFHDHSVARARDAARQAGLADRVSFEVADARHYPGDGYDVALFCDSLHDMGDPVAVARHARRSLAPGGRLVTLDPATAGDNLAENLRDPFAALLYPVSTMICTPAALAQQGPLALGALAGERALRAVLHEAGFGTVERVPATPINMVLYAFDGDGA